jgi:hypothetical protein
MNSVSGTRWPRDLWDMFPIGLLAVCMFLLICLNAHSSVSRNAGDSTKPRQGRVTIQTRPLRAG